MASVQVRAVRGARCSVPTIARNGRLTASRGKTTFPSGRLTVSRALRRPEQMVRMYSMAALLFLAGCGSKGGDVEVVDDECLAPQCGAVSSTGEDEGEEESWGYWTSGSSSGATGDPVGDVGAPCGSHDACVDGLLCDAFDDVCIRPEWSTWEASVDWARLCVEDGFGEAEVFYVFSEGDGGEVLYRSATVPCSEGWPDEAFSFNPATPFRLDFGEEDAFSNDFIGTVCWPSDAVGAPSCGPVAIDVLRGGAVLVDVDFEAGLEVRIEFRQVPG